MREWDEVAANMADALDEAICTRLAASEDAAYAYVKAQMPDAGYVYLSNLGESLYEICRALVIARAS